MIKGLAFLPEVPGEIEAARDWYAVRNPKVAGQFLNALEGAVDLIENHPQQGAYHDDRRLYRYRRLTKFPFIVVYREYEGTDADRRCLPHQPTPGYMEGSAAMTHSASRR